MNVNVELDKEQTKRIRLKAASHDMTPTAYAKKVILKDIE